MAVPEVEVSPGYLHGIQCKAKKAISILCSKNALDVEDARAIRLMSEVIGCLDIVAIRRFRRDKILPFAEDYNLHDAILGQPHE